MCLEKFCGKMCEMHKSPINCLLHLVAGVIVVYALWQHNIELILVGFLIAVVGHIIQAISVKKPDFREKQLKAVKRTKKSKR